MQNRRRGRSWGRPGRPSRGRRRRPTAPPHAQARPWRPLALRLHPRHEIGPAAAPGGAQDPQRANWGSPAAPAGRRTGRRHPPRRCTVRGGMPGPASIGGIHEYSISLRIFKIAGLRSRRREAGRARRGVPGGGSDGGAEVSTASELLLGGGPLICRTRSAEMPSLLAVACCFSGSAPYSRTRHR